MTVASTIGLGDAVTWASAAVSVFAAIFTLKQASVAKQQLNESRDISNQRISLRNLLGV